MSTDDRPRFTNHSQQTGATLAALLIAATLAACRSTPPSLNASSTVTNSDTVKIKAEVWADNWFAFYLGNQLVKEDSVPITTERSFNAESFTFEATYPLQLNFIAKDYKQNDTGLEYIGTNRQQMGDGGFIAQFTNVATGKLIAATDTSWACTVIHEAPLDKSCATSANPIAGQGPCGFKSLPEPANWKDIGFDDSAWPKAIAYTKEQVGVKEGYNTIIWHPTAKLIWVPDLQTNNTLLCRLTLQKPASADSTVYVPSIATSGAATTAGFDLSSAGVSNGTLSRQHTCDGASTSPPLTWGSPPYGTQSFAVVMHHVPGPGDTHWYWVNYQIPADTRSLSEGARIGIFGNNSVNGKTEYAPPCSKGPGAKTYTLTVYALAAAPDIRVAANQVSREVLLAAIKDRTLAQATIDVVYSR